MKRVKTAVVSLMLATIVACGGGESGNTQKIKMLKESSMPVRLESTWCKKYTIEELVNGTMDKPKWEHIVTKEGLEYINISGHIKYNGKPANGVFQFWLKNDQFGIQAFEIDKKPMNNSTISHFMDIMCNSAKMNPKREAEMKKKEAEAKAAAEMKEKEEAEARAKILEALAKDPRPVIAEFEKKLNGWISYVNESPVSYPSYEKNDQSNRYFDFSSGGYQEFTNNGERFFEATIKMKIGECQAGSKWKFTKSCSYDSCQWMTKESECEGGPCSFGGEYDSKCKFLTSKAFLSPPSLDAENKQWQKKQISKNNPSW
ncbi:MAG: hypothetical protein FWB90_04510 [Fibromonadales bacterium]|nr:hypothetical protein [Fibromonadales bacterium]